MSWRGVGKGCELVIVVKGDGGLLESDVGFIRVGM